MAIRSTTNVSISRSAIFCITLFSLICVFEQMDIMSDINALGLENVNFEPDSRVFGLQTWVVQNAPNKKACIRMCWLYSACSALTFTLVQQRCQLYRINGDRQVFRTLPATGSLAVDMTDARVALSQRKIGCNPRPCKETELCAPVKNTAGYVCIPLITEQSKADLPVIPNSEIASDDTVGSIVYSCAYGFYRGGSTYISTFDRESSTWSAVDITCTFVDCGAPPELHGARSSGITTTVNSEMTYSCLAGAASNKTQIKVTCEGSTGQWSPLEGSCSAVNCGQPPELDNMDFELTPRSTTDAFPGLDADDLKISYGAEAKYTCKQGYSGPDGASYVSQCEADGTWSSTDNFMCSPVDCGAVPHVANASFLNYTGTTFGENVTVTCLPGYSPATGLTFTCEEIGTWAGDTGTCSLINCNDPPALENGNVHYDRTSLNAEARYECEEATVVQNGENSTSTCQENVQWSPVSIKCISVPCGTAPPVDNSSFTYDLTQDRNFVVVYTCNKGFTLPPDVSTRTCNSDNKWSTTHQVTCDLVTCDTPTPPKFAEISLNVTSRESYSEGHLVTYSCQDGHVMLPASSSSPERTNGTLICLDGNWTIRDASAVCIACSIPGDVPFATWDLPNASPATAVYTCDPGYTFAPGSVDSMMCDETTGEWRRFGGILCNPVDCGALPLPGNGTVSVTGTKFNDKAAYSCNPPYAAAAGDPERQCREDGTWSGSELICEEWNCEPPTDMANGSVHYTSLTLHSVAHYTCDKGFGFLKVSPLQSDSYVYSQSQNVVCSDERNWVNASTQEPIETMSCVLIQCPSAPVIPNTRMVTDNDAPFSVNTTFLYKCLNGSEHKGLDPELVCMETGTWSLPFFECLEIDCGLPQTVANAQMSVENGTTVGSQAVYTCDPDFYLVGSQSTRTCQSNGTWSREYIECVPIGQQHCGDPPPLADATVEVFSSQGEWAALYTCRDTYEHAWTNTLDCYSPLYYWTANPKVECVLSDCGNPPSIDNADAYYNETTIGSIAVYQCHPNHVLSGSGIKMCSSTKSWSTEPVVECVTSGTIVCGNPPEIAGTTKAFTSVKAGSEVTYTCEAGFRGPAFKAACGSDGQWHFKQPNECLPVVCGIVLTVSNSESYRLSGTNFGDVVVYKCRVGYKHTGPSLRTCGSIGVWSDEFIECVEDTSVTCGDPPRRDFTIVRYTSREEGARAWYTCVYGYSGNNADSHCGGDGQWSDPQIVCEHKNCNLRLPLYYSKIPLSFTPKNIPHGRTISFLCDPGFTSSTGAPPMATCKENGIWELADPRCIVVKVDYHKECNDTFPYIANAEPVPHRGAYHVGSILKYVCDSGYFPLVPDGYFAHTCVNGPRWSSNPLFCLPGLCLITSPPPIDNAAYIGLASQGAQTSGTTLNGRYTCLDGYTADKRQPVADGSNTSPSVECSQSTGWLDTESVQDKGCLPIDCAEVEQLLGQPQMTPANCYSSNITRTEVTPEVQHTPTSPSTESSAGLTTQTPDSLTTQTPDSLTTQTPDSLTTQTPDSLTTQTPDSLTTQTPDSLTNQTPDSLTTQTNGSLTTQTPDSLTAQNPDNLTTQTPDSLTTQTSDSLTTQTPANLTTQTLACNATSSSILGLAQDTSNLCGRCEQSIDFPNGVMEIFTEPGKLYGVKASLRCDENHALIGNETLHCESVNGTMTWVGLEESFCVRNRWQGVLNGEAFYRFDLNMTAVITGFSACANVTYTASSKYLQTAVQEYWTDHFYSAASVIADETGTEFRRHEKPNVSRISTRVKLDETFYVRGNQAYVCIVLDLSALTFTFVNNFSPEMTMQAHRYEDLNKFKVGKNVAVNEIIIFYNHLVGKQRIYP